MSTLSLRLPESLHRQARELARRDGVSINQFISSAVAEKLAALLTVEYLEERANRGSREKFDAVLAQVPDRPADPGDELTHNMQQAARTSDYTAFLYLGRLIEYGATKKLFVNPMRKETEDYITGRFG